MEEDSDSNDSVIHVPYIKPKPPEILLDSDQEQELDTNSDEDEPEEPLSNQSTTTTTTTTPTTITEQPSVSTFTSNRFISERITNVNYSRTSTSDDELDIIEEVETTRKTSTPRNKTKQVDHDKAKSKTTQDDGSNSTLSYLLLNRYTQVLQCSNGRNEDTVSSPKISSSTLSSDGNPREPQSCGISIIPPKKPRITATTTTSATVTGNGKETPGKSNKSVNNNNRINSASNKKAQSKPSTITLTYQIASSSSSQPAPSFSPVSTEGQKQKKNPCLQKIIKNCAKQKETAKKDTSIKNKGNKPKRPRKSSALLDADLDHLNFLRSLNLTSDALTKTINAHNKLRNTNIIDTNIGSNLQEQEQDKEQAQEVNEVQSPILVENHEPTEERGLEIAPDHMMCGDYPDCKNSNECGMACYKIELSKSEHRLMLQVDQQVEIMKKIRERNKNKNVSISLLKILPQIHICGKFYEDVRDRIFAIMYQLNSHGIDKVLQELITEEVKNKKGKKKNSKTNLSTTNKKRQPEPSTSSSKKTSTKKRPGQQIKKSNINNKDRVTPINSSPLSSTTTTTVTQSTNVSSMTSNNENNVQNNILSEKNIESCQHISSTSTTTMNQPDSTCSSSSSATNYPTSTSTPGPTINFQAHPQFMNITNPIFFQTLHPPTYYPDNNSSNNMNNNVNFSSDIDERSLPITHRVAVPLISPESPFAHHPFAYGYPIQAPVFCCAPVPGHPFQQIGIPYVTANAVFLQQPQNVPVSSLSPADAAASSTIVHTNNDNSNNNNENNNKKNNNSGATNDTNINKGSDSNYSRQEPVQVQASVSANNCSRKEMLSDSSKNSGVNGSNNSLEKEQAPARRQHQEKGKQESKEATTTTTTTNDDDDDDDDIIIESITFKKKTPVNIPPSRSRPGFLNKNKIIRPPNISAGRKVISNNNNAGNVTSSKTSPNPKLSPIVHKTSGFKRPNCSVPTSTTVTGHVAPSNSTTTTNTNYSNSYTTARKVGPLHKASLSHCIKDFSAVDLREMLNYLTKVGQDLSVIIKQSQDGGCVKINMESLSLKNLTTAKAQIIKWLGCGAKKRRIETSKEASNSGIGNSLEDLKRRQTSLASSSSSNNKNETSSTSNSNNNENDITTERVSSQNRDRQNQNNVESANSRYNTNNKLNERSKPASPGRPNLGANNNSNNISNKPVSSKQQSESSNNRSTTSREEEFLGRNLNTNRTRLIGESLQGRPSPHRGLHQFRSEDSRNYNSTGGNEGNSQHLGNNYSSHRFQNDNRKNGNWRNGYHHYPRQYNNDNSNNISNHHNDTNTNTNTNYNKYYESYYDDYYNYNNGIDFHQGSNYNDGGYQPGQQHRHHHHHQRYFHK